MNRTKYVVAVVGPTAVGKTRVAIELALKLNTEIISADSRQCYREMNIGVARPRAEELAAVPHHFIASHSIHHPLTAAAYEKEALTCADQLFRDKDIVVLTGGTGLYIRAFCEGLDEIPDIDNDIRAVILQNYRDHGIDWLQGQLAEKDPAYYSKGEIQNPHRMLRALEVVEGTGQSILSFHKGVRKQRPFQVIKIGLELPRPELYQRINERVEIMIQAGLEQEVRSLYVYRDLPPLQTVGYAELFDYFDGRHSLERAVELIQQNTRHYAKRQLTWFRRDEQVKWFHPAAIEEVVREVISNK